MDLMIKVQRYIWPKYAMICGVKTLRLEMYVLLVSSPPPPPSIPTPTHTHPPGQQYNKDGILEQWWTNYSIANFRERQQCFVDQYSQYELFGYHVSLNTVCES